MCSIPDVLTLTNKSLFIFQLDYKIFRWTLKDSLRDIINMLRNSSNAQVEYVVRSMKKWAKDNLISVPSSPELKAIMPWLSCMDTLRDVINMLRNTTNPQVEYITRTMKKWAKENLVPLP
ncbi:hypothetical protein KUTeg_003689 [Tegillarca granosa]|uniref:Uncharacterized protein n=1 Tax=Tegillarca granosa TaxID=220873 RepID=A0ABQ9FSC6_TEGGR|nr:hypothetical protein KUTeg_003689 [Tegillarca granosa]